MRKFLYFSFPIVVLGIFVLIMHSGAYFQKQVLGTADDFIARIELIIDNIENSQWKEAEENSNKLNESWKKITKKIQFSEERDEMIQLDITIARLKGAIDSNDKPIALVELSEAKMLWHKVGK